MRVILVSEDADVVHLLQYICEMENHLLTTCRHDELLPYVKNGNVDFVVMDLESIPDADVIGKMKLVEKRRWLPIMAITSLPYDQRLPYFLDSGVDSFITKPINRAVVNSRFRAIQKVTDLQLWLLDIINSISESVFITDAAGIIILANEAAGELLGHTEKYLIGKEIYKFAPRLLRKAYLSDLKQFFIHQEKNSPISFKILAVRRDKKIIKLSVRVRSIIKNNEAFYIWVPRDITADEREKKAVSYTAEHDVLTGLPNRLMLYKILENRRFNNLGAILFIDLDGFKPINDTYGHHVGDELLIFVAERLRENANSGIFVGRLGGDEFVLVHPIASYEDISRFSEQVIDNLSKSYQLFNSIYIDSVSASIGVTCIRNPNKSISELLAEADEAMYEAKCSGKGRVCFSHTCENHYG